MYTSFCVLFYIYIENNVSIGRFQCLYFVFQFFNLKVKNPKKPVAPGLCVPAIVEFETNEAKEIRDRLVVTVDGDVVEIPLIA